MGYIQFPRMMIDVDNDARADYCRILGKPGDLFISCTLAGESHFKDQSQFVSDRNIDLGLDYLPRTFRDINNDKRADLCRYAGTKPNIVLRCNYATDTGFDDGTAGAQIGSPNQKARYNQ